MLGCDCPGTLLGCRTCDVPAPPGAPVKPGDWSVVITLGKRQAPVVFLVSAAALFAALFVAPSASADPPAIAAKEAASKALGTGWSRGVRWRDVVVDSGPPPSVRLAWAISEMMALRSAAARMFGSESTNSPIVVARSLVRAKSDAVTLLFRDFSG